MMQVSAEEWELIAEFNGAKFPQRHRNVGIPNKCAKLHRTGELLSDKQMEFAKKIRTAAYKAGFDFVD